MELLKFSSSTIKLQYNNAPNIQHRDAVQKIQRWISHNPKLLEKGPIEKAVDVQKRFRQCNWLNESKREKTAISILRNKTAKIGHWKICQLKCNAIWRINPFTVHLSNLALSMSDNFFGNYSHSPIQDLCQHTQFTTAIMTEKDFFDFVLSRISWKQYGAGPSRFASTLSRYINPAVLRRYQVTGTSSLSTTCTYKTRLTTVGQYLMWPKIGECLHS